MKNSGRNKNYKHGRKNQWRNWAWKEIASRIDNVKDSKVLYLAGWADIDRRVAVRSGFSPDNIVAVDNSLKVVSSLRRRKVTSLCGDIFNIIYSDPEFFDVFYIDLCCGYTEDVYRFISWLVTAKCGKKVILLNLQRGRDQFSSKVKKHFNTTEVNRAKLVYFTYCIYMIFNCFGREFENYPDEEKIPIQRALEGYVCPCFRSYKGSSVVMDTIIFNSRSSFHRGFMMEKVFLQERNPFPSELRSLAAAKAIRTMKMGGKLAASPRW